MPNFTAAVPEECKDIECAVCLEPWDKPTEIQPCGHVFCLACTQQLSTCPDCRAQITGRKAPNRILVNMADAAEVKCEGCGWRGSREASRNHTTCSGGQGSQPVQQQQGRSLQPGGPLPPNHNQQQQQPPHFAQHHAQPMQKAPMVPQDGGSFGPWSAYGLKQEQYDHIVMVFMTFDQDDSGELDRGEITTLARWLNYAHSPQDIDTMFRQMDTDGSGALSLDEFCRWVSQHRPDPQRLYGLSHEEYEATLFAFHSYDRDNNGLLDANEFASLAMRQGWARTAPEAQQLFGRIDTDRNARVDLDEILRFRQSQKGGGAPMQPSHGPPQPMFSTSPSHQQPQPPQQGWGQPPQSGGWQQPPAAPPQQQQHSSGIWQQPPAPPQQQQQQQQQQQWQQAPPLQPQQPRMLDGRVVSVELPHAPPGPYFVSVSPIASAPELFKSEPASSSSSHVTFDADFSVPVYMQSANDVAVFRVYSAADGRELCGATMRIADIPPASSQPLHTWAQLFPKDAQRFPASGARIQLRLSMIG